MSPLVVVNGRLEYLERQLRGKIRAGCPGSHEDLIQQVLNEAEEYNLRLRLYFASEMRRKNADEIKLAGTN